MATGTLEGSTIASTYKSLLKVKGGANTELHATTHQLVEDGHGNDSVLSLAIDSVGITGSGSRLYFSDKDGEYISGDGTNLTITSGADIILAVGTAGSVYSSGDGGTSNTIYGKNAGDALDSGGNYNVFIGEEAGTGITVSDDNVAIGYNAFFRSTTQADKNVAIGSNAMSGNNTTADVDSCVVIGYDALSGTLTTDADGTIAIGHQAGKALTSGFGNVAIGYQALDAATDSDFNTAVGYQALSGVTSSGNGYNTAVGNMAGLTLSSDGSRYNTLIGARAGAAGTTGYTNNTVLGTFALDRCTTNASHNVAIGYAAMHGDFGANDVQHCVAIGGGDCLSGTLESTASGTVAIGHQSLTALTSGAGNIAIGYQALAACDDGTSNTAIGYQAGLAIQGGVSNVLIGYKAGDVLIETSSNTVVGAGAFGQSSDGHDNVVIGASAGDDATDVGYAVIIGSGAGSGALTNAADGSILIGRQAGAALTTGNRSVAIGYQALNNQTEGGSNTVIGYQAMADANHSGCDDNVVIGSFAGTDMGAFASQGNVFIGHGAASGTWVTEASIRSTAVGAGTMAGALNTANDDTCIGYHALSGLTTGNDNVGVGSNAGDTITTGTENTCVGYNADVSASGSTNQSVIGSGATGVADNSVTLGNSSVTDVFTYGNLTSYDDAAGEVEFIVMDMTNTTSSNGDCTATISAYGDRLNGSGRRQMGAIKFDKELQWQASPPGSNDASIGFWGQESETLTEQFHIASNGDLTARDTSIGSISDSRLKENVEDYSGCLNIVKELRPVTFNYINPSQHQDGKRRGFLAQEIKEVDDYWVGEKEIKEFLEDGLKEVKDKDGKITQEAKARSKNPDFDLCKDTDHISLTSKLNAKDAMYVGAIKELLAKVETLESKVAALEG